MAIEKKTLKDVSTNLRTQFQKGQSELNKNNVKYAIELLKFVVQREPGFMDAREALRTAERNYSDNLGGFKKFLGQLKSGKFLVKAKSTMAKNPKAAMSDIEEALAINL